MGIFPCRHLKPLEAQFLWYLAEQSRIEAEESRGKLVTFEDGPAFSRLMRALESLDEPSYHDFLALMWLGRGDHDSYAWLRDHARSEQFRRYAAEKDLCLHCYIRTALERFGVPPIHPIDERRYPQRADPDGSGAS